MFFYNQKLGFYCNYYNELFFSYIIPYQEKLISFYNLNQNLVTNSCLLVYPILYKKVLFFEASSTILKRKKMKNKYNLNQTLILEGTVSSKKCIFTVPLFSFFYVLELN
jgi:hypothetical protein